MIRKLTPSDLALWAALPMAHSSQIEERLKIILDHTRPRHAMTRRILIIALSVGAAALIPLAMLRPAAKAQGAASASAPAPAAPWKQTLANGTTVELLGVSNAPTRQDGGGWWRPDGAPLAGAPFGPPMDNPVAGRVRRAFAVRVLSPPTDPGLGWFPKFEVPGAASIGTGYSMISSYAPRLPGLDVVSAGAKALSALGDTALRGRRGRVGDIDSRKHPHPSGGGQVYLSRRFRQRPLLPDEPEAGQRSGDNERCFLQQGGTIPGGGDRCIRENLPRPILQPGREWRDAPNHRYLQGPALEPRQRGSVPGAALSVGRVQGDRLAA